MRKGKKNPQKKYERELIINKMSARPGVHELVIVLDHLKKDYNIGKIIRSAEVFSIHSIHLVGTTDFDPYPAKGALKRVPIVMSDTLRESVKRLREEGFAVFAFDVNTSNELHTIELPKRCAFIFGHEEFGPNLEELDESHFQRGKIKQWGKTESLNVSVAASLSMYEYVRRHSL